ncbi:MAG: family 20 glycosylhydrolase [Clostridia bacterium]|nr:family 20 glycosylhydrolase [Clostridia bacterium]
MEIKTYNFVGIDATQAKGIEEVKEHTGIGIAPCGLTVEVKKEGVGIHLVPADGKIQITYGRDFEFYRALSQLNYVAESGRAIHETTFMSDLCFMADMSRNAVYNLPAAKKMIRYLALAGYSSLMFYTEDTFTVDEYKYFGHMRGRFSKEELRELDDYAFGFGIEVIPCVQTLAHLACALKWPEISAFQDIDDILLVDDERTYKFIDAVLDTCRSCFRSKRINIGMDEAQNLGHGKYIRRFGYKNQHEIMLHHLNVVTKMCHDKGYHPMIWSDMFFRMINPGQSYYSRTVEISQDVIDMVPEGLTLIYWDYYKKDEPYFAHMVDCHLKFTKNPIAFAGGAWKWSGFAPNNRFSINFTKMQMKVCREKKLDFVIVTCWGDDGAEAAQFSTLPGILYFAEQGYHADPKEDQLNRRALECFGMSYTDLLLLDEPNQMPGIDLSDDMVNPSKYLLYADPLEGLFDLHMDPVETPKAFAKNAATLEKLASHPIHGYMFDTLAKLCRVLELKSNLTVRLRDAYQKDDRKALADLAEQVIPEILARLDLFILAFRKQWYLENKTFVFSNHETRLGGLRCVIESAALRVKAYLNGEISRIEELEQPVLWFREPKPDSKTPYICHNIWETNAVVGVMGYA